MKIKEYKPQNNRFLAKAEKVANKMVRDLTIRAAIGFLIGLGLSKYDSKNIEIIRDSQKIESISELEKITQEEAKKLGLDVANLKVEFFDANKHESSEAKLGYVTSYNTHQSLQDLSKYLVVLVPDQHNVGVLRHELYHIAKEDCTNDMYFKPRNRIARRIREEWKEFRCNAYAARGIKL